MIRLMHYSNEFDIEGLIASAAGTPGELKEKATKPHLIREIVVAYGQVRRKLLIHAEGCSPAVNLLGRIKSGNPNDRSLRCRSPRITRFFPPCNPWLRTVTSSGANRIGCSAVRP